MYLLKMNYEFVHIVNNNNMNNMNNYIDIKLDDSI